MVIMGGGGAGRAEHKVSSVRLQGWAWRWITRALTLGAFRPDQATGKGGKMGGFGVPFTLPPSPDLCFCPVPSHNSEH